MNNFEYIEKCVKKVGLQAVIDYHKWNNIPLPGPEGYAEIHEGTTIKLWYPWSESDFKEYKTYTNPIKLGVLRQFMDIAPKGKFAEFGVQRGGVVKIMLGIGRKVLAFDTFKGSIGSTPEDYHPDLQYGDIDNVFEDIKNAEIIKGVLPNTLRNRSDRIAFAHFDLNLGKVTGDTLAVLYPMMVENGIIIINDYGTWSTVSVKSEIDKLQLKKTVYLPTGQLVIFK